MNQQEFDKVVCDRFAKIAESIHRKNGHYAGESPDRLHNFTQAAAMQGISREQVCWGWLAKHLISLQDMVGRPHRYLAEEWDEKITDAINYLFLLEAIVTERRQEQERILLEPFEEARRALQGSADHHPHARWEPVVTQ